MTRLRAFFQADMSSDLMEKLVVSILILAVLSGLRLVIQGILSRRVTDVVRRYHWRRGLGGAYAVAAIILVGRVWVQGLESIATFLGLTSAGLAIAMHDTIANISGFIHIVWRKPFKVGDRIQIGDAKGDVIDVRLFQFSMVEVGNWVDADQSTGRIIHVPNSKVLRENLANYETGFEYVWHEIPVLVTFESNWEKAKQILTAIAATKTENLSKGAAEQVRLAAMRYLIYFKQLTPIVYTSVRDSGVLLTMRYIVKTRQRRSSEQEVWEAILREFARHDDIDLAYPTTRFYAKAKENAKDHEHEIPPLRQD